LILSTGRASIDRITELVYMGSRIAKRKDFDRLRACGVRAAVDLKREGPDLWPFEAFLWLPTHDHQPPNPLHLQMGLSFLRRCEEAVTPVFVNCMMGVGRSATLVLAHLLVSRFQEASVEEALAFLASRRPAAAPNLRQIEAAVEAAHDFAR
jgi:hypothetical protein